MFKYLPILGLSESDSVQAYFPGSLTILNT